MRVRVTTAMLIMMVFVCTACGKTGDLYLPAENIQSASITGVTSKPEVRN